MHQHSIVYIIPPNTGGTMKEGSLFFHPIQKMKRIMSGNICIQIGVPKVL